MTGPGRGALVAGLVALLFGVVAGFEISAHAEFDGPHEKPNFDSYLDDLATEEKLQAGAKNFDYFKFSQRWPGTYCKESGYCCRNVASPSMFTVNGLWPENDDGSYPTCCRGEDFDQSDLDEDLLEFLEKYWPRASCASPTKCNGRKAESVWQQEWQKHGTCASPLSPQKYFKTAGALALKYDIGQILKRANFVPHNVRKYGTQALSNVVKRNVGATPDITCKNNKLYEIQLCLTRTFQLRDCKLGWRNSCSPTFLLPTFDSTESLEPFDETESLKSLELSSDI